MTDRYYRLIAILVNICPYPLRELFLKHAHNDPNYTQLDAYLTLRKTDIQKLKSRNVLRQDQMNLIYPQQGQVNINQWDITLLSCLLKKLFQGQLQQADEADIDDIRQIRNELQHISGTAQISDSDFTNLYQRLLSANVRIALSAKNQNFADKIKKDIETTVNSVITDLGDILREWYTDKILKIDDELQKLKKQSDNIQEDTSETRDIVKKASVKRVYPGGKVGKRMKTLDHITERLRENFKALLKLSLLDEPQGTTESKRIATQLKNNHLVVVAGFNESPYQTTAFSVINTLEYDYERCVVIECPQDWRHISEVDVDLVVFLHPFGKKVFDKEKAKQMHAIFEDSCHLTSESAKEDSFDVVIVTDKGILDEWEQYNSDDVTYNPIVLYKPTTEEDPVDLISVDTRHQYKETDPRFKNLLDRSTAYCKCQRGQFTDDSQFHYVLDIFRTKKIVVISGPRGSEKTALVMKLLSSYQEGHYVFLTEPEELAYISFEMTCVVVIEDLDGKYEIEKPVILKWFRVLDVLHAVVKNGKLNMIITCDFVRLISAIPATYIHPLLQSVVAIPTFDAVKVKEEPITDELAESQRTYFITARTDSKELIVHSGDISERILPSFFSQFRDGSFLFLSKKYKSSVVFHFSSDMEYISRYRTDYKDNYCHVVSVCCVDAGFVLITKNREVKLYRLSDERFILKQATRLPEEMINVCSNMNEVYAICRDKLFVLNDNLELCKTVEHLAISDLYNDEIWSNMVFLQHRFISINEYSSSIIMDNTKVKEIKILKNEGFEPSCLCAAYDKSIFVLGRQGNTDSRILQLDMKMNVLSDITIANKTYFSHGYMLFDRATSRLIVNNGICEIIYLK